MKFTPYVLYMTHIKKRFLATSNSAIFKMAAKKNKMADTTHEDVFRKLIISQFLFIIVQQTWYQIKAKSLPFGIQFKYANYLILHNMHINEFFLFAPKSLKKSYKLIMINITICDQCRLSKVIHIES